MVYQYFSYVSFYDPFISVHWGTLFCTLCWVSINALLMMIFEIHGHLIVVVIGIPIIIGVVYNLRQLRLRWILFKTPEKVSNEVEALILLTTLQQIVKDSFVNKVDDVMLIGLVNLFVMEHADSDSPYKKDGELYDAATGKFSKFDLAYHKDYIFLNHFNEKQYCDFIEKFSNSVAIQNSFASFLFVTMRNVHAALVELNLVTKKKPSLKQEFNIHRQKSEIEEFIKQESAQSKDYCKQLTNIIKFEELLTDCRKCIDKVVNYQIEFWSQVANQLPDLNVLHDLANKIYASAEEANNLWDKLCSINPAYPDALQLYGSYLIEIRNNNQLGTEILDK